MGWSSTLRPLRPSAASCLSSLYPLSSPVPPSHCALSLPRPSPLLLPSQRCLQALSLLTKSLLIPRSQLTHHFFQEALPDSHPGHHLQPAPHIHSSILIHIYSFLHTRSHTHTPLTVTQTLSSVRGCVPSASNNPWPRAVNFE